VGANPIQPTPCPGRMGALEKSIRGFAEREVDEVVKPELGTTFDSLTEAYVFYNLYSWEHVFGIRYGKSWLNPDKRKTMQEIACGCSISATRASILCLAFISSTSSSFHELILSENNVNHGKASAGEYKVLSLRVPSDD
jgi:hypothetical protein